jgi:hypothetical protein
MITIRIYLAKGLCEPYLLRGFIMSAQASSKSGVTLATGAKPGKGVKPTKAQIEHAALIEKGSSLIADAAWSAGSGQYNLTGRIREALSLVAADSMAVLSGAFSILSDKAKPDPIPAGAGPDVRAAMEKEAVAKQKQWVVAGNTVATICRQARDSMSLDQRPVVSIKLDRAECKAVVTIVPAGASRAEVEAALDHDKKALAQVAKKLDKEDAERAEIAAKAAGLPSPKAEKEAREKAEKEEKEAADLAAGIISTSTGRPLSDFSPLSIAACLAGWPSKDLVALSALLTAQAGRNAKAEEKAAEKAAAKAAGKPTANAKTGKGKTGKAAGKSPVAPATTNNGKRADKSADAAKRDASKPTGADNLTDPSIKSVPAAVVDGQLSV